MKALTLSTKVAHSIALIFLFRIIYLSKNLSDQSIESNGFAFLTGGSFQANPDMIHYMVDWPRFCHDGSLQTLADCSPHCR